MNSLADIRLHGGSTKKDKKHIAYLEDLGVLSSDVSGIKKVEHGRVREFPKLEISGTSMSSFTRFKIFGYRVW